jgi:hypothetical protein
MKFNLKKFAEKSNEGNKHTEQRLKSEHSEAPTSITQKQLEKDRVPEKNSTMEALLESKRLGSSDKIIEKGLNDSKGGLHKHRNAEAHSGNLNKVEQQRLSKKPQEKEKYEAASSTPSNKRWWDKLKASANKKVVTASDELDFEGGDRWNRMNDSAWSGADEDGVLEDQEFDLDVIDSPDEDVVNDNGGKPLSIAEVRPVDSPIGKGLYAVLDITQSGAQLSPEELQEAAYNMVIDEGYGYLANVSGFTPESFKVKADQVVARLFGDEFYPKGNMAEESDPDLMGDNPFIVSDLQQTDVDGIVLGTVNVDPQSMELVQSMDDDDVRSQVMDAILAKHDNISVESDGLDLEKLLSGEISFVGEVSRNRPKRKSPESWENVVGKPIASTDFDIVVLSNTKKN